MMLAQALGRTEYYPFPFISFFTLFSRRNSECLTKSSFRRAKLVGVRVYDILCALLLSTLFFLGDDKTVQPYFTVEQTLRTSWLHDLLSNFYPFFPATRKLYFFERLFEMIFCSRNDPKHTHRCQK